MAPTLRRRLICYYCGKRSNQKMDGGKFKCEHCLAVNYLDEDGNIADVPIEMFEVPQDNGPIDLFEATETFCSTCLKNQRLYTATLSEYLPDQNDPNYGQIERSLPEFKRKLDERYPQCCAHCEPRVRAKLQLATYNARTDHMRRMLERSRMRRISNRWGWRSLLVNLAGLAYFGSLGVQLLWHAMGSQSTDAPASDLPTVCFSRPVPQECVETFEKLMIRSLLVGLFSLWWNPKWLYKLKNDGRLVGLSAYYKMQLIVLVVRFGGWVWLTERPSRLQPMLHSILLIGIALLSGTALWTIRIDATPLVNWDYKQPALVTKTQYVPPPAPPRQEVFPISSLAATTNHSLQQWRPPTPPTNEDRMDWAPSYTFDQPKQPRYRNVGPSPFHSTLPAIGETKPIGLPPGHFDRRDRLPEKRTPVDGMAEPKFFPQDLDTGLENIFGQVFSLHETTNQPTPPLVQVPDTSKQPRTWPSQAPLVTAALLVLALVLWSVSDVLAVVFPSIRLFILGIGIVPLCRVAMSRRADIMSAAIAVEVAILITIEMQSRQQFSPTHAKLGAGILTMLALQEFGAYAMTRHEI